MRRLIALVLVLAAISHCRTKGADQHVRVDAARLFTSTYAHSRLKGWNVRATAAGADCSVLFIDTAVTLEDAMVEAMHYGVGAYDVYDGGVQQFSVARDFRGVAYRDATGRIWTYGAVTEKEARQLSPCR